MRVAAYVLWIAGLGFAVALIGYQGFGEVLEVLALSGWGIAWVTLFHVVPLFFSTLGWRALLERTCRPPLARLFELRWIGESVNSLLPVGQIGGDVVRARLASSHGVPGPLAGASVVSDVTLGLVAEMVFALAGVGLLVHRTGGIEGVRGLLLGLLAFTAVLGVFYWFQRAGLFRKLAGVFAGLAGRRRMAGLVGDGAALDEAVRSTYRRRRALLSCSAWRLLSWVVGAGEVWLALRFLGRPVSVLEAVFLESLGQAVRSAAFVVPGALGVQESGYLVLGRALGLPSDVSLALSLMKRGREVILGVPGLVAWQVAEGRRLFRRRPASPRVGFSAPQEIDRGITARPEP